ncbi:MAG: epoxyqueuosine reductase [Clostridia bacterium]|nr:epoxyqueuosine reductase [Clostridia bacterium]
MYLNTKIEDLAKRLGIAYFGVADLSNALDTVLNQGGDIVKGYPYSISLGIPLLHSIVDQLPNRHQRAAALNYKHHAYDIINQRLDITASILSSFIQEQGHRVLPIPAAERIDDERICASFSHKLGAGLSGLGWIGKSCLLITPEHGPRVRWTSILTDAPLVPTGKLMDERCGDCIECVNICPVNAFSGRAFNCHEPREARYDARKCEKYFNKMEVRSKSAVCGMCLYICPYGRK